MFMIISKVLSVLLDPAALSLILLTVGIVVAFIRKSGTFAIVLFLCGFGVLLVFSSPITAHYLLRGLEGQYPPRVEYGPASAVVLLGGATVGKIPPRVHVETNYAGNRLSHAARVFKQSGTPVLVLAGGQLKMINDDHTPEADAMFEFLNELFGIDSANVILDSRSLNTRENALYARMVMKEAGLGNDIILVTSANHMPRSAAVFRKAGFTVTPAPTGYFEDSDISHKPLRWLPSAEALFKASIAFHEYGGLLVYKILGWI
jgi:uncharacterized SAM-binding protein YcdF (DUF218 family)